MGTEALAISPAAARVARTVGLDESPSRLRYVKGARLEALQRLGVTTVRELFLKLPRRYLDFTHVTTIAEAPLNAESTVVGTITKLELKRPRPRMNIVELYICDNTATMRVSFFKQPWLAQQLTVGDTLTVSGKVTFNYGFKEMKAPFHEVLAKAGDESRMARVVPVHPLTEGLSAAWMRRIMSAALEDAGDVCDFLPAALVARLELPTFARAIRTAHFPSSLAAAELARRRLAYDELICLQLALRARHDLEGAPLQGYAHPAEGPHLQAFMQALPFKLTDEQAAAVAEITKDMAAPEPMNRLLLGDVGTGKTVVAAAAMALCADAQTQCAVMAPTSVLANQYAQKVGPLLDAARVSWCLITGATPKAERQDLTAQIEDGRITVVFGTSAILSSDVVFQNLTLVIVDEQHRFGVNQRSRLAQKGRVADVLTMTATPIPRTLALSIYGDVEVSRMRARPVAGAGIQTKVVAHENLDLAYGAILEELEAGHQAYVVCPLIDDADDADELDPVPSASERKLTSATAAYEQLSQGVFGNYTVELMHGRLTSEQKDTIMQQFRAHQIDVLVSTTVIEVGVDVPNATAMLVYDADRFGLATLHQLRGRVGRGSVTGRVFLETHAKPHTPARARLDALEQTSDGFELAELDLKLRHEGDILGYRQSGVATLTLVDMMADSDLIEAAHADATSLLEADPTLSQPAHALLAHEVRARYKFYFEEGAGA